MQFPTRWDPFFCETMTLADVYHFPTHHFDFRDQLTLNSDWDADLTADLAGTRMPSFGLAARRTSSDGSLRRAHLR